MKRYRYIKSNAFTAGASLGNPAACLFTGQETLSPEQMQAVAREHKGFVMEVVFCSQSDVADCKLTYYSSDGMRGGFLRSWHRGKATVRIEGDYLL